MPEPMTPREILDRLVAFPTVSRDSNLPLIDWVEEYLTAGASPPTACGTPTAPRRGCMRRSGRMCRAG